jgi:cephalosporin-C deacetylase-like acetyl esterase
MKKASFFLIVLFLFNSVLSQNLLPEQWKFSTGDDPQWADVSFNDSGWDEIIPGKNWESQGYGDYDGFAWYRVTFTVPSSLKEVAKKYGGFNLQLGKIDDVDFTYLNGALVGSNGKLPPDYETRWNVDRNYRIPEGMIAWGQPNILAIRVFDLTGGGGIYGFPIQLAVRGLSDFLSVELIFETSDHILKEIPEARLMVKFENRSRADLSGRVTVKVVSDFNEKIRDHEYETVLSRKAATLLSVAVPGLHPGFYTITVSFTGELAYKVQSFGFGYEPEQISSPPDARPDFMAFWERAKQELASVDPRFQMIRVDSLCTKQREVYLVEMHSLGDVLIRGWYSVPSAPGRYPAIMQVPGYSGQMLPEYVDYGDGIIGFGLNIRGHGNSRDDVDPGFPGFLFSGLDDKETYVYRGAYMDCIRGIDFLFSRPEVDTTRVGVEGASQGGGLTFAVAALDNTRIRAVAPQIPFLSDFPDYFKLAPWPANEFVEVIEMENRWTWDEVFNTLSYFDIRNLAGSIRAPLLMAVGMVDDVCPPHINFAAYNQVKSGKQYIVYPGVGHWVPEDFYIRRMAFFRETFGLK